MEKETYTFIKEPYVPIPAGQVFAFTQGEYCDHSYTGHYVALEMLDADVMNAAYTAIIDRMNSGDITGYMGGKIEVQDESNIGDLIQMRFGEELVRMGKIIPITCWEVHLGSCGKFELS